MGKYNVICIKWGSEYSAQDVNKLCHSIKRNTSYEIDFYCFTDDATGLDEDVIVRPMTSLNVAPEDNKYAYRKEAGLCDDNLGGLQGQRVFFFDLDSLIVGNLDEFFDYPKGDKFYIINDWNSRHGKKKNKVGQASCYSFVVGTLGYVKKYFEDHPKEVLSSKVIEKYGALNFWPDNWFKSYRFHCLPWGILRWIKDSKMPKVKGLKMIAFHGQPGIQEAIEGKWSKNLNSKKYPRGIKRLYKHCRPASWVAQYWK